ncbi:MAG: hypothetical protein AAB317_03085 [Nitrospirota bacterium]
MPIKNSILRYYHLYVFPREGANFPDLLEIVESATECCQYDTCNFVIATTLDVKDWYTRLEKFVEPGGRLFICEINIDNYWGFMNNGLWKMLKKGREGREKKK